MSREIIHALIPDGLSTKSWFQAYVLLIGQLCVWLRLNERDSLPENLIFSKQRLEHTDIHYLFRELAKIRSDTRWQNIWLKNIRDTRQIPAAEVEKAWFSITTAYHHKLLRFEEIPQALTYSALPEPQKVPDSLAKLISNLLTSEAKGSLYAPYQHSFHLALSLTSMNLNIFCEQTESSALDEICEYLNPQLRVVEGHPILAPGCFHQNKLQDFDFGLAILTKDHRYKVNEIRDIYGRFNSKNRYEEMLLIQHIFSRCRQGSIVVVPGSFLQKNTDLQIEFRRSLIKEGILKTIIKLPKNIFPGKSSSFYLLVGDSTSSEKITLFNADYDYFKSIPVRKKGGAKILLNNHDVILEQILNSEESRFCSHLSRETLIQGSAILDPSFYKNEHKYTADKYLVDRGVHKKTQILASLVNIIRAQAVKDHSMEKKAFIEVTINDINEAGEVAQPKRTVHVTEKELKRVQQQQLQPGDILLAIKGQAGRLCMVPELCGNNWIANQAFVILRLKENSFLQSPVVLFRFLRSESGRQLLDKICVDNNVPFIHSRDLKQLPIPQWSETEQRLACQQHQEILKLYAHVSFIRDKAKTIEGGILKEA